MGDLRSTAAREPTASSLLSSESLPPRLRRRVCLGAYRPEEQLHICSSFCWNPISSHFQRPAPLFEPHSKLTHFMSISFPYLSLRQCIPLSNPSLSSPAHLPYLTQADTVVEKWDIAKHGHKYENAEEQLWCSRIYQAPLLLQESWGGVMQSGQWAFLHRWGRGGWSRAGTGLVGNHTVGAVCWGVVWSCGVGWIRGKTALVG